MSPINSKGWAVLRPLLNQALELPELDRAAWFAEQRKSAPELAAEIEELLARELIADQEGFLGEGRTAISPLRISSLQGQLLGAYRLERPLGHGGMGSVWLARRNDGRFEGVAAIKFLSLAVAGPMGEARFRREGSMLARLTHPNVARLLDAGVSASGQPYLVLEHIDGRPLDQWCDQRQLSVEERVRLFLQVIAAVAHAHANLIVHRDLKPSNILVTGDGTVKLLDFGIAKLLEEGGPPRSALTGSGEAVLTFEYAAPEQIRGDPVSIRTDVYSLGVVLYQLLAGQHPTGARCNTPAEHVRAILETDPGQLSRVVTANAALSGEEAGRLAAARGASPERLRRLFAGDLDNILAKALRKDPAERYPTATAFADDLTRYLSHEPVSARPDAWSYRAGKFVRRHRGSVSSALLVALALVGAAVVTALQAREARRQRDAAVQEVKRQRAQTAVGRILAEDSRGADGRQLSQAERIALALGVLRQQFQGEPWLVAEVMVDLSDNFYDSGDRQTERSILAQAQQLARDAEAPAALALASCRRVYSFAYDDVLDSAHADLREAKASIGRTGGASREVERHCLDAEGQLLVAEGHADSAIPLFTRALQQFDEDESPGGSFTTNRLQLLNDLAQALRADGQIREASRYQRMILSQLDSGGYALTEVVPNVMSFLTATLSELGEFTAAESTLAAQVRKEEAAHGVGHATPTMAFLLGRVFLRLDQLDSTEIWFNRAMRDTSAGAGGISYWVPPGMAQLRLDQHRVAEARPFIGQIPHEGRKFEMLISLYQARARWEMHDSAGALVQLEEGIRKWSGPGPKLPVDLAIPLITIAEWRLARRQWHLADSLARKAREVAAVDSLALTRSAMVGRAELVLARALREERDAAGAKDAADRALVALSSGSGSMNVRTVQARALVDSLAH